MSSINEKISFLAKYMNFLIHFAFFYEHLRYHIAIFIAIYGEHLYEYQSSNEKIFLC